MVISLTPDIEQVLREMARQQGTTIEFLALKALRERLFPAAAQPVVQQANKQPAPSTSADFLKGYVGVLDSGELREASGHLSQQTGKRFADILAEKRRQGRL